VNGPEWNQVAREVLSVKVDELQEALAENDLTGTLEEARKMAPTLNDGAQRILARRLIEVKLEATLAEMRALEGQPLRQAQFSSRAPQEAKKVARKGDTPLSVAGAAWLESKRVDGKMSDKDLNKLEALVRIMVEILGDRPVCSITKDDMRELRRLWPQIPSNATKKFPGLSTLDAIKAGKAVNADVLAPGSVNNYFQWARSLWLWLIDAEYAIDNPATPRILKAIEDDTDNMEPFTDEHLKALFGTLAGEREGSPAMYYVPLLMLYGGLRLEEAAQLRPKDIREEHGVWVIDVNEDAGALKTENAARLVPLHSAIRDRVVAFAETRKGTDGNLWGLTEDSTGRLSGPLSKSLNRWIDTRVTDDKRFNAYSLRRTFATRLKWADVQEFAISELMGHAVQALSTGTYGKKLDVVRLKVAVERLSAPI
jgi:integrase